MFILLNLTSPGMLQYRGRLRSAVVDDSRLRGSRVHVHTGGRHIPQHFTTPTVQGT